jgi:hypothetical protein
MQTKHRRDEASRCFEGIRNTFEGARMRGISVPPGGVGDGLKQNAWGGSGKPKFAENRACLASAADHENSVTNRNFMILATNMCILDDF